MFSQEQAPVARSRGLPKTPLDHFNVNVPFRCQLKEFSKPMRIRVVAFPKKPSPPARDRFEVNLEGPDGEIVFHFNPRFEEKCVVRNNTNLSGQWQKEEREGGMPFSHEKIFTLDFIAGEGEIRIHVNGDYFCDFVARENLSVISTLSVDGNVDIHCVSIIQDSM